jgi:mannose/cellobiose epimerase-like protein (N-acyl-D-glucosamine 2-epimerase family)
VTPSTTTTTTKTIKLLPRWALLELYAAARAGQLGWSGEWRQALGTTIRPYTLKRRTTCRACGQAMTKGSAVLRPCFDLNDTGGDPVRWFDCYVHPTPCCARAQRTAE